MQILFKGKCIDKGEWVLGCLSEHWDDCCILWGMSDNNPIAIGWGMDVLGVQGEENEGKIFAR